MQDDPERQPLALEIVHGGILLEGKDRCSDEIERCFEPLYRRFSIRKTLDGWVIKPKGASRGSADRLKYHVKEVQLWLKG